MTTATQPLTTALIENGMPIYATDGCVTQEGKLKIMVCRCGAQVVWATSARTGRKYRVNISRGHLGQRFYRKNNVHRCEEHVQDVQKLQNVLARNEASRIIGTAETVYETVIECQPHNMRAMLSIIRWLLSSESGVTAAWDTYYGGVS